MSMYGLAQEKSRFLFIHQRNHVMAGLAGVETKPEFALSHCALTHLTGHTVVIQLGRALWANQLVRVNWVCEVGKALPCVKKLPDPAARVCEGIVLAG